MLFPSIIIAVIIFTTVIFLLRFIFSRDLNVALNRLNTLHEENLVKEAQLTEELQRAREQRDAEIKRGREESAALIEEAKKEAIQLRFKMIDEAKLAAEKIILQAKEDAGKFKEKVSKELQEQSLHLAVEMIKQTFSEDSKRDLQIQCINEIIEEIAKLPREKFSIVTENVKVLSSYPLLEGQRDNLKEVLNEKMGFPPKLEEAVDKELMSGLIIEMNGLIIDGTLKNKLRRIIPYLKKNI